MIKEKNKGGRLSKIIPFLIKAEEVLSEEGAIIIYTDEDLVDEINDRLPESDRIHIRTFQNWKAQNKDGQEIDEVGLRFFRLIKKALRRERKNLLDKLREGKSGEWQKYAWILERKFDEWNLTKKILNQGEGVIPNLLWSFDEMYRMKYGHSPK